MGAVSASVILLCEDSQTDKFLRRFLRRRFGHRFGRRVHSVPFAAGSGSGEQRVREQFPDQLQLVRGRRRTVLIAVIDADTESAEARRTQLQRQCAVRGIDALRDSDPVLVVIPRRSIETWFHYLSGYEFDETTRYPHLRREADCVPLADRLYDMCHEQQKLAEPAPASLVEACRAYPRLTHILRHSRS